MLFFPAQIKVDGKVCVLLQQLEIKIRFITADLDYSKGDMRIKYILSNPVLFQMFSFSIRSVLLHHCVGVELFLHMYINSLDLIKPIIRF